MSPETRELITRILKSLVDFIFDVVVMAAGLLGWLLRVSVAFSKGLWRFIGRLIKVERRIRSFLPRLLFPFRWLRYVIYHVHILPPWVKLTKLLAVLVMILLYYFGSYAFRYHEISELYEVYYPKLYAQLIAKKLPPATAEYYADYYASYYAEYYTSPQYKKALRYALPQATEKTVSYPVTVENAPMHITTDGLTLIKRFEGLVLEPYLDVGGKMTIGYGHLVRPGEYFAMISEKEAEQLLRRDIQVAEAIVKKSVTVKLTSHQYSALVSLVYNIGSGHFEDSTLLEVLNEGNYEEAAEQFLRWVHVDGTRVKGLVNRRVSERQLFLAPGA